MHGESQISEHLDRACLAALEVSGGKPLAGGELVAPRPRLPSVGSGAPPRSARTRRRRGEPVLGEELLGSEPVVVRDRAHYIVTADLIPRDRMCQSDPLEFVMTAGG